MPAAGPVLQRLQLRAALPWIAVFIPLLALHLTAVSNEIGGNLGGDGVVYYLLGQALAQGLGYVDLYLPGHPPHLQYPFLFPLILAGCHLLSDRPLILMHTLVAALNAGAALILGAWAGKRRSSRNQGLLFAALFGTIPVVYLQSLHLLSEPLNLFFCALGFLLLAGSDRDMVSPGRLALLFLAIAGAYFTRTAGLTLALAAAAALSLRRQATVVAGRRLPAGALLATLWALAAGAWLWRCRLAGGASPYLAQLFADNPMLSSPGRATPGELVARFYANALAYLPGCGGDGVGPAWALNSRLAGALLLVPLAAGLVKGLRSPRREAEIYYLLTLLMVLAWPFREKRFLYSLTPLGAYFIFAGIEWGLAGLGGRRLAERATTALLALTLAAQAGLLAGLARERFADRRQPSVEVTLRGYGPWSTPVINYAKYDTGYEPDGPAWRELTRRHTDYLVLNRVAAELVPAGAVIVSRKPMWTYYLSGRTSVPALNDPDPIKQWEYLEANRADYIILGLDEPGLAPLVNNHLAAGDGRMSVTAAVESGRAALIKIKRLP